MSNIGIIISRYLPLRLSLAMHSIPMEILESVNEIRLRKKEPVSLTMGMRNIFFDQSGAICRMSNGMCINENELSECISKLTCGSLYTCDEYLAQGFLPLKEGGRVGISGRGNYRNGRLCGFSEITSVNIRIHRFLPYIATELVGYYRENGICGTIVCGPPAFGKTTFLKSIAFLLSNGKGITPKRIAVADEREEIGIGIQGGILDVLSGIPKAQAITMLTRTMSPEAIICDEIAPTETESVIEAQNTGVCLIASSHCHSPKELLNRGSMKKLLEYGLFPLSVVLDYKEGYICNIQKTEDLL